MTYMVTVAGFYIYECNLNPGDLTFLLSSLHEPKWRKDQCVYQGHRPLFVHMDHDNSED